MRKLFQYIRILFFLVLIIGGGWKLGTTLVEYKKGVDSYSDLVDQYTVTIETEAPSADAALPSTSPSEPTAEVVEALNPIPDFEINFEELKKKGPDVVGWLYCAGTPVNYPIVQAGDNDYYLYRLLDGTRNSSGSLFMDFRNTSYFNDGNNIVYGHNMKNGSMFALLPDYLDQEFYDTHPIWYLMTEEMDYVIELVGGYVTPADSDTYTLTNEPEGVLALADKARRKSSFVSDVEVTEEDKLITLSTCVYDYENARYVLVGVLRPYNYED